MGRGRKRTQGLAEYRYAAARKFQANDIIVGSVYKAVFDMGGEDFMDWLISNTPKGTTLAESLTSFAIDAMNENMESGK
jgi:hypothetical protein